MNKKPLFIFVFIILSGCTSTNVFVNHNYTGIDKSEQKISILPVPIKYFAISNIDDVVDDFEVDSAKAIEFIRDSLYSHLILHLPNFTPKLVYDNTILSSTALDNTQDSSFYFTYETKIGSENNSRLYSFQIPKNEGLQALGINPDIVVIFNDVHFERNAQYNYPNGSSEFLGASVTFVIWDYKLNDIIKCGTETIRIIFWPAMTDSDWNSCLRDIGKKIFTKTQFSRY